MNVEAIPAPEVWAVVAGTPFIEVPSDLFIPPDALEVLLDSFSGPLDLLLYLIRRQNIDILDIPILMITQQYMQYIHLMEEKRLELAADYLVMAALLAEIKSRMLLPVSVTQSGSDAEEDPRMALVRRLQAYELFKEAAMLVDQLPRYERDVYSVQLLVDTTALTSEVIKIHPDVELSSLSQLMRGLLQRQVQLGNHQIAREPMSVRDRMNLVLQRLQPDQYTEFTCLFSRQEGRMGLVVTLLAILELSRQSLLIIMQPTMLAPIHVKAVAHE